MKRTAIKDRSKFKKVLKGFGFEVLLNEPQTFVHYKNGWYADILDQGNYCEVWAIGKGLKDSPGFPGGWNYGTAEELEIELTKNKP